MIIDSRLLPEGEDVVADVCIVGAGPAGLALARDLIDTSLDVCLLESGGLEPDEATLSLTKGESVGLPYDRLDDGRFRAFGGGSHTWTIDLGGDVRGARLRALEAIDFEKRDWVPYSGWPFDRAHLDPYYERAHAFLRTGPANYDEDHWFPTSSPSDPVIRTDRIEATVFQFTPAEVILHEHREAIHRAGNVRSLLFSNVTGIDTDEGGTTVSRLQVACLGGVGYVLMPSGTGFSRVRVADTVERRFAVRAKVFVLAAGATENARLLLLSNGQQPKGLGNQHDLVGRFFMEHPHMWSGRFVPFSASFGEPANRYGIQTVGGVPVMAKWILSERVRRKEHMLGYCVSLHPHRDPPLPEGAHSLLRLVRAAKERKLPHRTARHLMRMVTGAGGIARTIYERRIARGKRVSRGGPKAYRLDHMAEQAPNPESRVTLSSQRDALGQPRIRLDWRLTSEDMRSMVRAQEILDAELRRIGVGRLQIDLDQLTPPRGLKGGWHHMGTTRMHTDPKQGVVDATGRVHGVSNLYLTGSSVFPTVGYANPLLTVCALAIRLADHVRSELTSTVEIRG